MEALSRESTKETVRPEVVTVTPKLAKEWLTHNKCNRTIREQWCLKLASDMRNGRWQFNGETIKFSISGDLLDGQHRLEACIRANVPFETVVVFNATDDCFRTIDIGTPRRLSDSLLDWPSARTCAAIAVALFIHDTYGIQRKNNPRCHPSKPEALDYALQHKSEIVEAARAARGKKLQLLASSTITGTCSVLFHRQAEVLADRFFDDVSTGVGLDRRNPAYHLRERLQQNNAKKEKLGDLDVYALFFKAWIAYKDGKKLGALRWCNTGPSPQPFPQI